MTSLPMQEHPDGSGYSALCADKTGSHEYVLFAVKAKTAEECERHLDGHISDGFFENCRVGKVVEVLPNGGEKTIWEDWTYILKDDGR